MGDRFVTVKEFEAWKKNYRRELAAYGVRELIKTASIEQLQSEDFPDETIAVRNDRDSDYTDTGYTRWGTFLYKDLPKLHWDARYLVFLTCVWEVDASCYTYFRLRNGAAGYDQSGTTRWVSYADRPSTYAYNPMAGIAFFDIAAESTGDNARICADVKVTNSSATITVIGNTNLEGADCGGCEIRAISVGRY